MKVVIKGIFYGKNRTCPGWNDRISASARHPQAGAKMEREFVDVCGWEIRKQLKGVKIEKPIRITYTFHEADRRRDVGNIAFVDKPFCDALQRVGILPNDNQEYVRELHFVLGAIDKNNPRIEIEIEVLDES